MSLIVHGVAKLNHSHWPRYRQFLQVCMHHLISKLYLLQLIQKTKTANEIINILTLVLCIIINDTSAIILWYYINF